MNKQNEQPFASVLEAIFTSEETPLSLLYRLSDMSDDDFGAFKRGWPSLSEDRRVTIARHMADISEDNYSVDFAPVFLFLFEDESASVRVAALDGMWDAEDTGLVAPILSMLQGDPSNDVRAAAARALAHFLLLAEWGQIENSRTPQIVEVLLTEYARPTATLEIKRAALEAVSPAPDPRIADIIEEAYEIGNEQLQLSALFAMGNSADDRWLEILEHELSSNSPDFRAEAARAVGMIGDKRMIDELEQLLMDDYPEVVVAAIYALGMIGGDRAFEMFTRLAEDPEFEEYQDAIDEVLEEMEWSDSSFDMLSFPSEEDDDDDIFDDDDEIPDDLRLN